MFSSAVNHQQWISAKKQKHQEQLRYEQQQKNTNNQLDYLYWQGKQRISAVKHQPKNSNNKKHQQYEKHQKKREKTSATNWIASTCCNICFLSADKHRHCQLIFVFLVSKTMKKSMSNKIDINFEICIGNVLFNTWYHEQQRHFWHDKLWNHYLYRTCISLF